MIRCMGCMEIIDESTGMCPYCGYQLDAVPTEAFHLMPGTVIGNRYTIGTVVESDTFGITYIAWDEVMEKKVAVKEYFPSGLAKRTPFQKKVSVFQGEKAEQFRTGMEYFVSEARELAQFRGSTDIIDVYDCMMENDTAYSVTELLEGESLKNCLQRVGKISLGNAEKIILPILESLIHIHSGGLIHRDISPENIYLTRDGRVKLQNFGAARYAASVQNRSLSLNYKQGYAAEEQYRSRGEQGPWTDIYALAATLYTMITGLTPESATERRAHDTLKPPSKAGIAIPRNKETALLNALNVQAENRTQCSEDFLEEWFSEGYVKRQADRVRRFDIGVLSAKWKISIILLILVVVAGMGIWATGGGMQSVIESIQLGANKVRIPSVVNATIDVAKQQLEEAGITLQIAGTDYSTEIEKGLILEQKLPAGSIQEKGTVLEVRVSGGIRQIYMPEVLGIDAETAKERLLSAGFSIKEEETYSSVLAGNVVDASVAAETQCDEGFQVTLFISKGLDPAVLEAQKKYIVRDITGSDYDAIRKELEANGIKIIRQNAYSDTVVKENVISQSVKEDMELQAGDTMILVVSLGKEMVRIPDLIYKSLEEATKELDGLAIELEIKEEYSESVKSGLVIWQSIIPGKTVNKGSKLSLIISTKEWEE